MPAMLLNRRQAARLVHQDSDYHYQADQLRNQVTGAVCLYLRGILRRDPPSLLQDRLQEVLDLCEEARVSLDPAYFAEDYLGL